MNSQSKEANVNPQEQGATQTPEQHIPNPGRRRALKLIGGTLLGVAVGLVLPNSLKKSARADSSAPSVFRTFLPIVAKESKEEPPLRFLEFGNLETEKVLFMNRSNTRFIELGEETLYKNLFWRRNNYAPYPNIKRTIVFFESLEQLQKESWILYNFPHNTAFHPGNNYIGPSERRWTRKPDDSLEFHISIPSPKQGVDLELAKQLISGGITLDVDASLWSNEEGVQQVLDRFGNGAGITGSQKAKDFQEHPIATRNAEGLQIAAFSVVFQ